ncbi:hypothetical protein [Kaarinaea lacus]
MAKTFSTELHTQLDHCLARIEQRYRDELEFEFDIQNHCPSLAHTLARHEFSIYLQPPLEKNLTVEQLMDLLSIVATIHSNSGNTTSPAYRFDFHSLSEILNDTLIPEPEQDLSWWKRFLNWLAEYFDKTDSNQPDWLKDWLAKLSVPPWVVKTFYTGIVILLAILLLAIIIVEVRAAGISNWFKRRSQQFRYNKTHPEEAIEAMLTWEAILQLPAKEKILSSYKKLLYILASKNLIPADSSLTNYEIQTCLEKSLGSEQTVFRQLIRGVETTVYGDQALDHNEINEISHSAAHYANSLTTQQ